MQQLTANDVRASVEAILAADGARSLCVPWGVWSDPRKSEIILSILYREDRCNQQPTPEVPQFCLLAKDHLELHGWDSPGVHLEPSF